MTDRPDLTAQYQGSSKTLEDLNRFRAQKSMLGASMSRSHAPSSSTMPSRLSAPEHSLATSNASRFDSSRLHIPSTAYPRGQPPHHQQSLVSHVPSVASTRHLAPYHPMIYREPLKCIKYEMVFDRIYLLLRDNLPEWWTKTHEALHHLTRRISEDIIRRGQHGAFGPRGLASLTQIFIGIGHENAHAYMCLAVQPSFGDVQVILRGDSCEQEGMDPIFDHTVTALCREGFDKRAAEMYREIRTTVSSNKSRK